MKVAEGDLEDFLARLRAKGIQVSSPSRGMKSVVDASRTARRPVIEIVKAILAGDLARVELLPAEHRFASVFVDPDEVVQVLDAKLAQDRMTLVEAAEILGLEPYAVRSLISEHDAKGRPFLRSVGVLNTIGTKRPYFETDDVETFRHEHAELSVLASEFGISAKALRKRLGEVGVEPILPRSRLNKYIYRRADL